MKNPFSEFRAQGSEPPPRKLPMEEILAAHTHVLDDLKAGFKRLIEDEAGDGLWQPDGDSIVRVYEQALAIVTDLEVTPGDVEAFALASFGSEDPDFFLMGPLGLYVSALCNTSQDRQIGLSFQGQDLRLPLLGYRLEDGRTLSVDGHLGDLTGISMTGGGLSVSGHVGRYLGAGMVAGRIDVGGDAGRFVGEQMVGGEIHVQGRLGGVGKPTGGVVYHRRQCVYGDPERAV